jgi:hypothetical protein
MNAANTPQTPFGGHIAGTMDRAMMDILTRIVTTVADLLPTVHT